MSLRASLIHVLGGLCASTLLLACSEGGDMPLSPDGSVVVDAGVDAVVMPPDGGTGELCPPIFSEDVFPVYHVDIAPAELAELEDEFFRRVEREAMGLPEATWHPITFTYQGQPVPEVMLKLKGSTSWLHTIEHDVNPKMQFVIAFNEVNPERRWQGVRKIELDMPRGDYTFTRQRLALFALRDMGLPAQCANSAQLYLNGQYYGLYTNLERMDKEFLQLRWPGAADGDLWKSGFIIKTNEETFTWDRIDALDLVTTPAQMDELVDMDASIEEWASEAMIGDADGYYNGRPNFYLYDHPTRGFIWIAHDLDTVFAKDYLPSDASPVWPFSLNRWEGDWYHFLLVMAAPPWQERYVSALATARAKFEPAVLQERATRWAAQIRDAAQRDTHRSFTMLDFDRVTGHTRQYVAHRADFIEFWLECRTGSADAVVDADGDGFTFCFECDDDAVDMHPGAVEACDGRDENCDGRVDNLADGAFCP